MLNPKFVEYLKMQYPENWQEQVEFYEKNRENLTDFTNMFCSLFGVESPYATEEEKTEGTYDPVDRPKHYVEQAATIEPIEVLRFAPFDLGNALKYMIRAGHKDNELQDLKKAEWYLECACETSNVNRDRYIEFFDRYGFILTKFDGIPSDLTECCNCTYIESLLDYVRERIANYKDAE